MTLEQILAGPVSERANFAKHDMTEAEARKILQNAEKHMSRRNRVVFIKMSNMTFAKLSPEARALYRAYGEYYRDAK